ncbi:MAG: M1 family aminopeptidase [Bacteroidia bacterium]
MFKKYFAGCCFALLAAFTAHAQQDLLNCFHPDPRGRAREHNIDVINMLLEVSFEPKQSLVKGNVTHTFIPLLKTVDSIVLDAVNMRFTDVKIDGKTVRFNSNPQTITIYAASALPWQSKHTLQLIYEANPKKGIYFVGWNDTTNRSRKQIWTQGQGYDNRHWIPAFDDPSDKLITEIKVTMPGEYKVLSNGTKLAEKKDKAGNKVWHYKMSHPHAFYLTMLGIGDYAVKQTKAKSGVPVASWYYPDQPEKLEPTYRYTERIMDIFEREIGVPYPWETYSQIPVQEFMYGAMENTTATIFGDFFYVDKRGFLDRNYVGVNAHEMAHQWFGDMITARSPNHHWLQESFATHYAKIAEREIWGEDYYQWNRRGETNTAVNASKNDNNPVASSVAGSPRFYQKGSRVLDMLKYVTGREEYNKAIKYYLEKNAYKNVTTEDLYSAFYDVLGLNLDWFFDQWLYHGGEPFYNVRYEDATSKGKRITNIYIDQTHEVSDLIGYFRMPIVVEVHYKDGSKISQKETVFGRNYRMQIPNTGNKEIDFVLFDPNGEILKQVSFEKSFEELIAQALKAPNMIDRYDALVELRNVPLDKKRETLLKSYKKETFHATKAEIISQLIEDKNAESISLLKSALQDKDVQVRYAVVSHTQNRPEAYINEYEKMLQDSSYRVIETALVKLVNWQPEKAAQYLEQTKNEIGMSRNLRITWLKTALLNNHGDKNKWQTELVDYTSQAFEFRTRGNAFNALQSLNYLDENAINNMFEAALSSNGRLARPALDALGYFNAQENYKSMINRTLQSQKWNTAQREKLTKLLKS